MKNRIQTTAFIFGIFLCFNIQVSSQVAERARPAEWDNLIYGGRFMDRFLPMPVQGELTFNTWGADNVVPRYVENGLEDDLNSYWGGNAMLGKDGKYHLFVCAWPEDSKRGHMHWPRSTVFHAVADNSFGPYKVKDELGFGHNPEVFQLEDGRYVVYVINGYYIADDINGPWEKGEFEFNKRDRKIIEGLSNLTFAKREDGTYLMVCRGGGVWFSKTGISPYNQVSDKRVYPPVEGRFEDPLIWKTDVQYHLIVNDWLGRIAWYLRSKDGISWKTDPGEAYLPGVAKYEDGIVVGWFKYERIKVLQDEYGRATQAHFAVIDTLKREDKQNDNHSSKHICIPLTVGRLLSVLNDEKLNSNTKIINVKIKAESGFDPNDDLDLESLRFGASEEVNFGRGSKLLKTEKAGDDLILVFDGKGNGITDDNFAGKLLGKTSDGDLLFGYSRLPEVKYIEPALSAKLPIFEKDGDKYIIEVEVQNFGQVTSKESAIKIIDNSKGNNSLIVEGKVPQLHPFTKTIIHLKSSKSINKQVKESLKVIIESEGQKPVALEKKNTVKE